MKRSRLGAGLFFLATDFQGEAADKEAGIENDAKRPQGEASSGIGGYITQFVMDGQTLSMPYAIWKKKKKRYIPIFLPHYRR